MEFAIALPLLLFVTMAVMQFALVATAKLVVNHAAFAAARAQLVAERPEETTEAEEAAEIICAPISGIHADDASLDPYYLPGRGNLARSGLSREKTFVVATAPAGSVRVDVTHDYELIFPIVSELFRTEGAEHGNWPHRRMTETCTLAKRWQ